MKLGTVRRMTGLLHWLARLGAKSLDFFREAGGLSILLGRICYTMATTRLRWSQCLDQMNRIGVTSLPLVFLTAIFSGMVLALQSAYQLRYLQAVQFTADLVALSITRELGPVLTAMVVAGRVGAGITAELGTMKVTEQIDALESLATDPVRYLVVPRFVASFFMLFILTVYADCIGMLGGYLVGVFKLDIASSQYIARTFDALVLKDIYTGLIKAFVFGIVIALVGCYYGFKTEGGAEGVGRATTLSVVTALILIISFDCLCTALFYFMF
jgi:phospholipid/cholesterol/gamma-HCH transport system permease protein